MGYDSIKPIAKQSFDCLEKGNLLTRKETNRIKRIKRENSAVNPYKHAESLK